MDGKNLAHWKRIVESDGKLTDESISSPPKRRKLDIPIAEVQTSNPDPVFHRKQINELEKANETFRTISLEANSDSQRNESLLEHSERKNESRNVSIQIFQRKGKFFEQIPVIIRL